MREPDPPSPFGAFLYYLFVGMRRDYRGFLACLMLMGSMIMLVAGLMLWGIIVALLGLGLLIANGRRMLCRLTSTRDEMCLYRRPGSITQMNIRQIKAMSGLAGECLLQGTCVAGQR